MEVAEEVSCELAGAGHQAGLDWSTVIAAEMKRPTIPRMPPKTFTWIAVKTCRPKIQMRTKKSKRYAKRVQIRADVHGNASELLATGKLRCPSENSEN